MNANYNHITVLLQEAIEMLSVQADGVYVDCTLGGGGHTRAILDELGPDGRLIVFDHDSDAWDNLPDDPRVMLVRENFSHIQRFLSHLKFPEVDGVLADLGVSSHHFDSAERGFSYRMEGPLDMRMDTRQPLTARDVLMTYSESELLRVLSSYGEVPNSKTLARAIVMHRDTADWDDTEVFSEFVDTLSVGNKLKYRTKVFQALRIEVNQELDSLEKLLLAAPNVLRKGGRLVIISFHSIEDRLVKNLTKEQVVEVDPMTGQRKTQRNFIPINKKPILPSEKEIKSNKRSRSAKMRVLEKI